MFGRRDVQPSIDMLGTMDKMGRGSSASTVIDEVKIGHCTAQKI
jgi:hypothetical protein